MKEDTIGRIAALAHIAGDESAAALAHELSEQLPSGELNLLVVGQFKRGKSSLVNALLGADVMPTGALPVTGIVTAIRHANTPSIVVRLRDESTARRISVDELPLYVSEHHNPGNARGVQSVNVAWPSERIAGFTLFDTPGIGSTYEHNTATARQALPRADAAILVVGPEPPIGADELGYARDVVTSSERLFIVLNKSDIAGSSLQDVLDFTSAALSDVVAGAKIDVVPLSATQARQAQIAGREDPDFGAFVMKLREFVECEGVQTRDRSARRRGLAIVHRLELILAMRIEALQLPRNERDRRKALVERTLQALDDRVRALELSVDDDVRRLRTALEEQLDRMHDRDLPAFRRSAAGLASTRSADRRGEQLASLVAERARQWREEAAGRADIDLRGYAVKYARLLGELETSALEAGCKALHVDPGELVPRDIEFARAELDLVTSVEPKTGLELIIISAIGLLPGPLRRPVLEGRYEDILLKELDALRGKLRYAIGHDLEPWRRMVRATVTSSIESTRHLVLQAFGELGSSNGSEESELERLHGLAHELGSLRAELQSEQFVY